jgi:hypothetical protein
METSPNIEQQADTASQARTAQRQQEDDINVVQTRPSFGHNPTVMADTQPVQASNADVVQGQQREPMMIQNTSSEKELDGTGQKPPVPGVDTTNPNSENEDLVPDTKTLPLEPAETEMPAKETYTPSSANEVTASSCAEDDGANLLDQSSQDPVDVKHYPDWDWTSLEGQPGFMADWPIELLDESIALNPNLMSTSDGADGSLSTVPENAFDSSGFVVHADADVEFIKSESVTDRNWIDPTVFPAHSGGTEDRPVLLDDEDENMTDGVETSAGPAISTAGNADHDDLDPSFSHFPLRGCAETPTVLKDGEGDTVPMGSTEQMTETGSNTSLGADSKNSAGNGNAEGIPNLSHGELLVRMREIQRSAKRTYLQSTSENSPEGDRDGLDGGDFTGSSKRARTDAPQTPEKDIMSENFLELDDEGHVAALAFRKATRAYRSREKGGSGSLHGDIEWQKLVDKERSRRNRVVQDRAAAAAAAEQEVDDDPLFEPMDVEDREEQEVADDKSARERPAAGPSRKGGAKPGPVIRKNSKVYRHSLKVAVESFQPPKARKNAKPKADKPSSGKGNGRGKKKKDSTTAPSGKNTKGTKQKNQLVIAKKQKPVMSNVGSLLTGNIFQDARHLNEGEETNPLQLTHRRRDEALTALVASLSTEERSLASVDKKELDKAAQKFSGHGSVYPCTKTGEWKMKGFKSTLKHFQMLGTAWMRERECDGREPRGGLGADQMGLGKTVMMLANIMNSLVLNAKGPRTTLIVVPANLVSQWWREIQLHCDKEALGEAVLYHGDNKMVTTDLAASFCRANIVLTTYGEILKSSPKVVFPTELTTQQEKEDWFEEHRSEFRGVFHNVQWLRVVIDEAHVIKNHLSQTSLGVRELMATHRWALTGTPIHNTLKELYPYFKFLNVPGVGDFKIFCKNYNTRNSTGVDRLTIMLNKIMLRRVHSEKLLGQPILMLPENSQHELWISFNEIERAIYQIVEKRIIERINNWSRMGQLSQNYSSILTLLLRLRQMTCHILIVELCMKDLLIEEDIKELEVLADMQNCPDLDAMRASQIVQLRKVIKLHEYNSRKQRAAERARVEDNTSESFQNTSSSSAPSAATPEDGNDRQIKDPTNAGGSHGRSYDISTYLESLREGHKWEDTDIAFECAKCGLHPPNEPYVTSCNHIYCCECITQLQESAAISGGDCAHCIACAKAYTSCEPLAERLGSRASPDPMLEAMDIRGAGKSRKAGAKNKDKPIPVWLTDDDSSEMLPSAKTLAVKSQIVSFSSLGVPEIDIQSG